MATILASTGSPVEATFQASPTWQEALKRAIRDGRSLCDLLGLPVEMAETAAETDFPVFAPLEYVNRMRAGDPADPLLLQVLGTEQETGPGAAGLADPVGDLNAQRGTGLLQKYDRRVLMITTGACAVHCRYCFRRHYPYAQVPKGKRGWSDALAVIREDESLDEVILSGGDPLTLSDNQLAWLVEQINSIDHIQRIRLHTRVPVMIPQRICDSLIEWTAASRAAVYFVTHFNHAAEVDRAVRAAMHRLRQAGATLLNQAVLLRGINDTLAAQQALCLALVNMHVLPYYLHQLDLVQGATHFEVTDEQAQTLIAGLRQTLPGYAVPKLVREVAGEASKTPL